MKALIIIPTYNESENIVDICQQVRAADEAAEILVVDDNSPDGTAALVRGMADTQIHLLLREKKEGLGRAYIAGFRWGLDRDFDRFVEMDADGSHPAGALPSLLEASIHADVVIGSRYVEGGRVRNWSTLRLLLSRWGNRYVQLMLGIPVRDATAGFRVFTRTALERIGLDGIEASGYGFQINMAWRAHGVGLKIVEVPITFTDRERGTSKMSGAIVREALLLTTRWGVSRRLRR